MLRNRHDRLKKSQSTLGDHSISKVFQVSEIVQLNRYNASYDSNIKKGITSVAHLTRYRARVDNIPLLPPRLRRSAAFSPALQP